MRNRKFPFDFWIKGPCTALFGQKLQPSGPTCTNSSVKKANNDSLQDHCNTSKVSPLRLPILHQRTRLGTLEVAGIRCSNDKTLQELQNPIRPLSSSCLSLPHGSFWRRNRT